MKKIAILGSTGSIGRQALQVCSDNSDEMKVVALTAGKSVELLAEQIKQFKPELVVLSQQEYADQLKALISNFECKPEISIGRQGLIEAATCNCDVVLNSLMGIVGLEPTYNAIRAGKDVALANKETLVAGGSLITKTVKEKGVQLLPVDSEHSAIFQCLEGNRQNEVEKLIITCSGGPFRNYSIEEMKKVTKADALKHPRWTMGPKITIDSATLMNKGLEVIEARWLFDIDEKHIQVAIHPESIVHSMVQYTDGAVLAQMGVPDMKIPIAYALTYPSRKASTFERLDFSEAMTLHFDKPDIDKFKCLGFAIDALAAGGSYTIALNGANEVLVSEFLSGRIAFNEIWETLERVMQEHVCQDVDTLEGILAIDREVREKTLEYLGR